MQRVSPYEAPIARLPQLELYVYRVSLGGILPLGHREVGQKVEALHRPPPFLLPAGEEFLVPCILRQKRRIVQTQVPKKTYHSGRKYKDRIYININTQRCLYFRSKWYHPDPEYTGHLIRFTPLIGAIFESESANRDGCFMCSLNKHRQEKKKSIFPICPDLQVRIHPHP